MSKNKQILQRVHPIIILYNSRWLLFVVILPLLRAGRKLLRGEPINWSVTSWIDFAIIFGIIILAVSNWVFFTYSTNKKGIEINRGIILNQRIKIDWEKVTIIKERRPFYVRLINAGYLKIDTVGGSSRKTDAELYLTLKKSDGIIREYKKYIKGEDLQNKVKIFKPSQKSVFNLAFVSTNNFAGIVYLAALISQSGKILGRSAQDMLVNYFEEFTRKAPVHIPLATAAISYFLLITWAIGVVATLIRYYDFRVTISGGEVATSAGFLGRQRQTINLAKTSYINIRQNIIAYFLDIFALYVVTSGVFKEYSDINCTIPNDKREPFYKNLNYLFPQYKLSDNAIRPKSKRVMLMLAPGGIAVAVVLIAGFLISKLPSWKEFLMFLCAMILIPMITLCLTAALEKDVGGIGRESGYLTIRYNRFFTFNTVIVEENKIVKTTVRQSIYQRISGNANIYFYTVSESRKTHRCRNLKLTEINELLKDIIGEEYDNKS